jgi:hypothetical protein
MSEVFSLGFKIIKANGNCSPFRKTKPKISCRSSSKLIRGGLDRGGG